MSEHVVTESCLQWILQVNGFPIIVKTLADFHNFFPETFLWNCFSAFMQSRWLLRSSGVAMGCAGCAMHKGPQPSEDSKHPRGSQQSEGSPTIWRAPSIRGAPVIWEALINLKGPRQSERPCQPEGPPAILGAQQYGGPQQSGGPRQSEEPPVIEGQTPESCCHFAQAFVHAVNEVNHLQNCSTARWLYYALSSTLSDVCTALHVVADVASDWTIIFKIEAHQKLYEVPCQKSDWATWQCG